MYRKLLLLSFLGFATLLSCGSPAAESSLPEPQVSAKSEESVESISNAKTPSEVILEHLVANHRGEYVKSVVPDIGVSGKHSFRHDGTSFVITSTLEDEMSEESCFVTVAFAWGKLKGATIYGTIQEGNAGYAAFNITPNYKAAPIIEFSAENYEVKENRFSETADLVGYAQLLTGLMGEAFITVSEYTTSINTSYSLW